MKPATIALGALMLTGYALPAAAGTDEAIRAAYCVQVLNGALAAANASDASQSIATPLQRDAVTRRDRFADYAKLSILSDNGENNLMLTVALGIRNGQADSAQCLSAVKANPNMNSATLDPACERVREQHCYGDR